VQGGEEFLGGRRCRHRSLENDVFGSYVLAVQILVAILVGPQGRALKRDTRKEPSGTRICQNLRSQRDVGRGRRIATLRTGGGSSIRPQLYLAAQNGLPTAGAHEKQNKVRGLPAKLKSDATAFQRDDGWRAPGSIEVFTGSASHDAATVAPTDADGKLNHGRE